MIVQPSDKGSSVSPLVEAQCGLCALVYELAGVVELDGGVDLTCECGGALVEVTGELLVDGNAGVLVDVELGGCEVPVDPVLLAVLIDGREAVA